LLEINSNQQNANPEYFIGYILCSFFANTIKNVLISLVLY